MKQKGRWRPRAYLDNPEEWKDRLEWGEEAQNHVRDLLKAEGLPPIREDDGSSRPPVADLEYEDIFIEVTRREPLSRKILMGHTGKADGWLFWGDYWEKDVWVAVINGSLTGGGIIHLSKRRKCLHKQQNDHGDIDYYLLKRNLRIMKMKDIIHFFRVKIIGARFTSGMSNEEVRELERRSWEYIKKLRGG
jgi:hypothetical protein